MLLRWLMRFEMELLTESIYDGLLSEREVEVLSHLANGLSYKAIAEKCGITMDKVRKHLRNSCHKFNVPNNTAAVAFALRNGVIV